VQVILHALRPGGIWLNVGPLLYHWARDGGHAGSEPSLELSLEDVLHVAQTLGFEMVERSEAPAAYNGDVQALYQTSYTAVRWVMRKPEIGAYSCHRIKCSTLSSYFETFRIHFM
jgi:carnosine N-methyltransferase